MTAPTDQSAALALLRERFPESEGWKVGAWNSPDYNGYRVWADHGELTMLTDSAWDGYLTAAKSLIASWDAATHADKVRALVKAAAETEKAAASLVGLGYGMLSKNDVLGDLRKTIAALPASLRGKGGGRG